MEVTIDQEGPRKETTEDLKAVKQPRRRRRRRSSRRSLKTLGRFI